jgi:hypothetical protein
MDYARLLDELFELMCERDALHIDKTVKIASVTPQEVKVAISDIQDEYLSLEHSVEEKITEKTEQVKRVVVAAGETVNGSHLQAVYAKGRVSWDSKGLDGFAVAHPEVKAFRKEGEPNVSIKSRK